MIKIKYGPKCIVQCGDGDTARAGDDSNDSNSGDYNVMFFNM